MARADSVKANVNVVNVKGAPAPGRSQIVAGTSEIRRMLIGRELFAETM